MKNYVLIFIFTEKIYLHEIHYKVIRNVASNAEVKET
jgi:hypothetical protein